ncbi:hypothetical protein ASPCAL00134 [Aspergillus calidoustus]|uniref:SsDNA binding protein n=1 Tax=Aspergillus calidoustus TaxID=454130 RepID=A0A0U5FMY7_ASPCI|nr:hypothetical protein ASPCAL00134 [Aspergillus calidoustus]
MSAFTTKSFRSLLGAASRTAPANRAFSSSASRSYARVTVTGHIGFRPELRTSKNGNEYLAYSIASTPPGSEETTQWFNVVAHGIPEGGFRSLLLSLQKGSYVLVDGELRVRPFTDKNGVQRESLHITQNGFEVLRRPRLTDNAQGEERPSE